MYETWHHQLNVINEINVIEVPPFIYKLLKNLGGDHIKLNENVLF